VSEPSGRRPEWWVFADATLAGLAALIPLPGLDLLVEGVFRRRIAPTIASRRGAALHPVLLARLGRGRDWLNARGCLLLPFLAALWLAKKLFRKLLYVLTVTEAASQISEYWHRAYLVDHLIRGGHLHPARDVERTLALFFRVLEETDTSPLKGVAREVARSPRRVLRLIARLRRGEAAGERLLDSGWPAIAESLDALTARFDQAVAAPVAAPPGEG
jgi:hypothetical protein